MSISSMSMLYRMMNLAQPFVLTKHVPHFLSPHTYAGSRNVRAWANIVGQLCHVGLTESHHFGFAFVDRVEICTAGRAAKGTVNSISNDIFKRKEFDSTMPCVGVEPSSTKVWTYCGDEISQCRDGGDIR